MYFSVTRLKGIAAAAAFSVLLNAELPDGWKLTGSAPRDYDCGVDRSASYRGEPSTCLKSRPGASPEGYSNYVRIESLTLHPYRGKRVRLSANVKAQAVEGWAGLWMRVEGSDDPKTALSTILAYDNMQNRPIKGTRDWQTYSVVLDVPKHVRGIHVGVLLGGNGEIWFNGIKVEVVDKHVPTTGKQ